MNQLDTPNVFLENLAVLHDTSTRPSKRLSLIGRRDILSKRTKYAVLEEAKSALLVGDKMLEIARKFTDVAADHEKEMANAQWGDSSAADYALVERLHLQVDWALHQADSYYTAARSYLRRGKRLTRRAWWMRG